MESREKMKVDRETGVKEFCSEGSEEQLKDLQREVI